MPTSSSASDPPLKESPPQQEQSLERSDAFQVAHNLLASFSYAAQGILYALRTQRNFRIHAGVTVLVISVGMALQLSTVSIAVLALTCGAVMALELINTALEAIVDLTVKQSYHELAKIAKDCAAGAVFIAALTAVIVAVCIIAPPLLAVVQPYLPF